MIYGTFLQIFSGTLRISKKSITCYFQGPYGTQKAYGFLLHQYFCTRSSWSTGITRGGHEAQMRPGGAGPTLDRATQTRLAIERRLGSVFL
jgi:hypothetical protein